MNDAAGMIGLAVSGGMKEEGAEAEDIAGRGLRLYRGAMAGGGIVEAAVSVAGGDELDGAIVGRGGIEMKAEDDHLLEHGGGGIGMEDTFLDGKGAKAWDVEAAADGDADVLVPGHVPIDFADLVEEDGADGEAIGTEDLLGVAGERAAADEGLDQRGEEEEIATVGGILGELALEGGEILGGEAGGEDVVAV